MKHTIALLTAMLFVASPAMATDWASACERLQVVYEEYPGLSNMHDDFDAYTVEEIKIVYPNLVKGLVADGLTEEQAQTLVELVVVDKLVRPHCNQTDYEVAQ